MKKINIIIALSLASGMFVNAFSPFENIILNTAESEEKIAVELISTYTSQFCSYKLNFNVFWITDPDYV